MSKLALKGGTPLRSEPYPAWPMTHGDVELNALKKVLDSGVWGTLGPEAMKFNENFAKYQGANYAVGMTNGTVTLEVLLRALDIGRGDEVIVPPYTFNATVSSVLFLGATPIFVDIESDTFNMDATKIEPLINDKTKAIIPVHVGGRSCDMDAIMAIAKKHNLYVVEDAAHSVGSTWKGVGLGTIGDAGSFSFQNSKNLTSGEGGAITTNSKELYDKCFSIHHCGRDMESGIWYDHPFLGTNSRLTEWQGAILNSQMDRLDQHIETREDNAAHLTKRLKELPFIETFKEDERVTRNAYHLFLFKYKKAANKDIPKQKFVEALQAEGIPLAPGYVPLYRQAMLTSPQAKRVLNADAPSYPDLHLPVVERIGDEEGMWLVHNILLGNHKDMDDIADAMIKVYENADELKD
ncbi:MAG: DegT/DnrJ/EryC1/StrS family aminotransferase [Clostridiales bacterium]|nr:DegT/DnrJ/EryC1/StrS family aminotransferase [Clostridiales bacterium]